MVCEDVGISLMKALDRFVAFAKYNHQAYKAIFITTRLIAIFYSFFITINLHKNII